MNALILGGTGLVGGHCLRLLIDSGSYQNVVALTRRSLEVHSPTLHEAMVSYDDLAAYEPPVHIDHVFCAFGTTIARAGSPEAMHKIDVEIPLALARRMKMLGASHFSLVSSLGANPNARSFYSQIKGELEVEVTKLGFQSLDIFRPSVIGGTRKGDARLAERLAQFFLKMAPLSMRTIPAEFIAEAMVRHALSATGGRRTIFSKDLWDKND